MNKLADSPAFPFTPTDKSGQIGPSEAGLTKREWLAGLAMQALVSNGQCLTFIADIAKAKGKDSGTMLGVTAVDMADCVIEQLAKTTSQSC